MPNRNRDQRRIVSDAVHAPLDPSRDDLRAEAEAFWRSWYAANPAELAIPKAPVRATRAPAPVNEAAERARLRANWDAYYAARDADALALELAARGTPARVRTRYRGRTFQQLTNAERVELARNHPQLFARMRSESPDALPDHPARLRWADLTNPQRVELARNDPAAFDRLLAEHQREQRGPFDDLVRRRHGVL